MPIELTPRPSHEVVHRDRPTVTLDDDGREQLLAIARAALAVATGSADRSCLTAALEAAQGMRLQAAAFVTLTLGGALRGCMGRLDPDLPVVLSVAEAASYAAVDDPRFDPVRADELDQIRIHVSVLGPYQPLADPEAFEPGVDGVLVERGWHRGLLLPEAAAGHDLGRHDVLSIACTKAGLASDAWRDRGTTVYAFRTVRFGGPAIPAPGLARATDLELMP